MNLKELNIGDLVQLINRQDPDLLGSNYRIGKIYRIVELGPINNVSSPWIKCENLYYIDDRFDRKRPISVYLKCFQLLDPFQLKVYEAKKIIQLQ
ncbi:hypothetical protein CLV58_109102 [Spirosoma oryzae]|uniref:Uncharacterized protein n=1 Tax=Spirosoma oryzae TaxID=1469603 RepID=A0A2T0SY87_9BACT|nr:hypothetical protein [Spirosoma oryzae]PRY38375.1 hypothetical protein CLV58_109102 [Spirosoma oryzae]